MQEPHAGSWLVRERDPQNAVVPQTGRAGPWNFSQIPAFQAERTRAPELARWPAAAPASKGPASDESAAREAPPLVHQVLRSPGQPLDPGSRAFFESRFGYDFSQVRVHTDRLAARSARMAGAEAYTVGNNMVFARGQNATSGAARQSLLAHELAHVVQQAGSDQPARLTVTTPDDASEIQASRAATAALAGEQIGPLSPTSAQIARSPGPKFTVTKGDLDHLQDLMQRMFNFLDERTRTTLTREKTVAIGLVLDPDGAPTTVYTVSGNWTNPRLREAATKLGLTRWEATPRAEGRGATGAPGDAEQIMISAADTNDFDVKAMAVSRGVCEDCKLEIRSYDRGGIRVVEVRIPAPSTKAAPAATPREAGKPAAEPAREESSRARATGPSTEAPAPSTEGARTTKAPPSTAGPEVPEAAPEVPAAGRPKIDVEVKAGRVRVNVEGGWKWAGRAGTAATVALQIYSAIETIDSAVAQIEKAQTGSVRPEVAKAMAAVDATFPSASSMWAEKFRSWHDDVKYPAARDWLINNGFQALMQKGEMLDTMGDHLNTLYWYNQRLDDLEYDYGTFQNRLNPIYQEVQKRTRALYDISEAVLKVIPKFPSDIAQVQLFGIYQTFYDAAGDMSRLESQISARLYEYKQSKDKAHEGRIESARWLNYWSLAYQKASGHKVLTTHVREE